MAHHYARATLHEEAWERARRRLRAGGAAAMIAGAMLWLALSHDATKTPPTDSKPRLLVFNTAPPPEPIRPPPPPPDPEPPHLFRPDAGGRSPSMAAARKATPPLPIPSPANIPDFAPAPVLPSPMGGSETLTVKTTLDGRGLAGNVAGSIGEGSGSGTGSDTGSGDGAGDGDVLHAARWAWKPTPDALRPFAPAVATAHHISGKALLACRVRLSKSVYDCRVLGESQSGCGFGAAALAASRIFRVHPPQRNGKPLADAWVGIPVVWLYAETPAETKARRKVEAGDTAPASTSCIVANG